MGTRFIAAVLLVGALAGCASTGASGTRRDTAELTAEEIMATSALNCFEAVRQLRPMWLTARSTSLSGERFTPVVFVDRAPQGDVDFLRSIPVQEVERLRFMNARDATTRYGTGYPAGIIEVFTRR